MISDSQHNAHTPVMEAIEPFRSLLSGTQHSLPYSNTESTQALYMHLLVVTDRCLSLKTAHLNASKTLDALAILLSTSTCIPPFCVTTEPK